MEKRTEDSNRNSEDPNYPPLLKLFHYDLSALKNPRELLIARVARWVYFAMCGILFFNCMTLSLILFPAFDREISTRFRVVVVTIVLAIGGVPYAGYWIIFAALESTVWMIVYTVAQSILAVVFLVFSIVSGLNFEGWTNWDRASTIGGSLTSFWHATTIIESILWTFVAIGAVICVVLMSCHIYHFGDSPSVSSPSLSMTTKAKIARKIIGFF